MYEESRRPCGSLKGVKVCTATGPREVVPSPVDLNAVGHIADQGKRKRRHAVSPVQRLLSGNAKVKSDKTQKDEARSLLFHGDSLKGFKTAAKVVAGVVVSMNCV
jgi:hypothetical protein